MTGTPSNTRMPYLTTAEVFPEDPSQRLIKLTDLHTSVANAVNSREISIYQQNNAIVTGQRFSIPGNNKDMNQTYRKLFYFGTINTGATLPIPHGINGLVQLTRLYGTCITNAIDYRPIPFADVGAATNNIAIRVAGMDIVIQNGATAPPITSGIAIIEYLLN